MWMLLVFCSLSLKLNKVCCCVHVRSFATKNHEVIIQSTAAREDKKQKRRGNSNAVFDDVGEGEEKLEENDNAMVDGMLLVMKINIFWTRMHAC